MKKMALVMMFLGLGLSLNAAEMKCGEGKCDGAKKEMKCDSGKCDGDKKAKSKDAMKCDGGKCDGDKKASPKKR